MPFRESRFLICWRMWSLRAISRLTRISINSPPSSPNAGKESEPLPVSKRNKAAEKTAAVQDASRDFERGISEDIQLVYDAFCRKLRGSNKAAEKTAAVQDASRDLERGISEDIQLVYDAFCRKLRGSNKAAEKTAAVQDASRDLEHGISEDIQLVYDAFAVSSAAAKKRQKRQPQSKTLREIWSVESARTFNLFMTLLP